VGRLLRRRARTPQRPRSGVTAHRWSQPALSARGNKQQETSSHYSRRSGHRAPSIDPMPKKLIEESHISKATIGRAGFGLGGLTVLSAGQAVHDGDTVLARALANISIRFLGVDTPEVAFALPFEENPPRSPTRNGAPSCRTHSPIGRSRRKSWGRHCTRSWLTTPGRVPPPITPTTPRPPSISSSSS
jgi:hypothetical protein